MKLYKRKGSKKDRVPQELKDIPKFWEGIQWLFGTLESIEFSNLNIRDQKLLLGYPHILPDEAPDQLEEVKRTEVKFKVDCSKATNYVKCSHATYVWKEHDMTFKHQLINATIGFDEAKVEIDETGHPYLVITDLEGINGTLASNTGFSHSTTKKNRK